MSSPPSSSTSRSCRTGRRTRSPRSSRHMRSSSPLDNPHSKVDYYTLTEAQLGAQEASAGFLSVDVLNQRQAAPFTRAYGVLQDPTIMFFVDPGRLAQQFSGFADYETISQAANNEAVKRLGAEEDRQRRCNTKQDSRRVAHEGERRLRQEPGGTQQAALVTASDAEVTVYATGSRSSSITTSSSSRRSHSRPQRPIAHSSRRSSSRKEDEPRRPVVPAGAHEARRGDRELAVRRGETGHEQIDEALEAACRPGVRMSNQPVPDSGGHESTCATRAATAARSPSCARSITEPPASSRRRSFRPAPTMHAMRPGPYTFADTRQATAFMTDASKPDVSGLRRARPEAHDARTLRRVARPARDRRSRGGCVRLTESTAFALASISARRRSRRSGRGSRRPSRRRRRVRDRRDGSPCRCARGLAAARAAVAAAPRPPQAVAARHPCWSRSRSRSERAAARPSSPSPRRRTTSIP